MRPENRWRGALLLLAACAAPPCDAPPDPGRPDNERIAVRALDWLFAQQAADGRFASAMHGVLRPGWSLTAAVLAATAQLPPRLAAPHAAGIARAFQCLLAAADADGAIGIDGDAIDYPTYTAAHWLAALVRLQPDGWRDLMPTIDALNQRFGRDSVGVASAARIAPRSAHASRQERRSPRYTTRLDEIVTARA